MSLLQMFAAAAAVVVAVGPQVRKVAGIFGTPKPSYSASIASLAHVRLRLKSTGRLGDAQKQAIDSLTLALVDGSDE